MIKINKNKISMTRGDTLIANVAITSTDGEEYIPQDGDSVRFALKHPELTSDGSEYEDNEPLLVKSIPIETMILKLDPQDTKSLGFGTYVYDLELTYANGDVDTFITSSPFVLTPEVY